MITNGFIQHKARKRFGQNFLIDQKAISEIVRYINPKPDETIIEIGPGLGAITQRLFSYSPSMIAIEIDRDLAAKLRASMPGLNILESDALCVDFLTLSKNHPGKKIKVVGNLPYNISTPLIFHIASFGDIVNEMYFMLQKELVDRLISPPGTKDYGKLSIMMQHQFEINTLFDLTPTSFSPQPRVNSSFISIQRRKHVPALSHPAIFEKIVSLSFQQRRKTLRNSLRGLNFTPQHQIHGHLFNLRPEQLAIEDFIYLSDNYIEVP